MPEAVERPEAAPTPAGGPLIPLSAVVSAAVALIVGFGGAVAIVVQAGQALGGSPLQVISMITALCLGIGATGAWFSWRLKMPIMMAWSTPGAALLAASALGLPYATAIGAFIVAALLMILTGLIPALGRLAERIPASLASAMLAGVLLPFCLELFRVLPQDLALAGGLLAVFLIFRAVSPNWSVPMVLVAAILFLVVRGQAAVPPGAGLFGELTLTGPAFDWRVMVSLGLPLFLVTLASQNLPGLVVLRAAGYRPPAGKLILTSGLLSLATAPFGGHGVNLAAITAAIGTGSDAHPDPQRRWIVGVLYGGFYLLAALFAAPLAGLFIAMPVHTLAAITGLALIGPLTGAAGAMLAHPAEREAAILTFVATGSGVALFGIGSAFWGLVVGFAALGALRWLKPRAGGRPLQV